MKFIGAKSFSHDSAVCVIDTKEKTIFAMSTERFTRIKHDEHDIFDMMNEYSTYFQDSNYFCHSFNEFGCKNACIFNDKKSIYGLESIRYLRKLIKPKYIKDLNITFFDKLKIILAGLFKDFPTVFHALKYFLKYKFSECLDKTSNFELFKKYLEDKLRMSNLLNTKIAFYDHHLSHAVSSYYFSSFAKHKQSGIALTLDGCGDNLQSAVYLFSENGFENIAKSNIDSVLVGDKKEIISIGSLYSMFTLAMGLRPGSDEGKVEALAAYGVKNTKLYQKIIDNINVENKDFNIKMNNEKLKELFNLEELKHIRSEVGDENFCATIQSALEDITVKYINYLSTHPNLKNINNLCLSGGVAANIIMNLSIYEKTKFKNIYIAPFMGDEGTSIGAAILKALELGEDISWLSNYKIPYFGDSYSKEETEVILKILSEKINYEYLGSNWIETASSSVANNKIIALFNGKMEFGPRALGNRSIIANPMYEDTRTRINSTVKRRPMYQPFCPSILEEERERLFENSFPHKHMATAFRMREKYYKQLPSAAHIDGTARPQFVEKGDNEEYFNFLKKVKDKTGFGVVINTSFNLHGRTIVRTPEDAVIDFIDCNIDELYINHFKVTRK